MKPVTESIRIEPIELLNRVSDMKGAGCRLVQICCTKRGDEYELDYSFDREYTLINIQMAVKAQDEIDSISVFFPPAFLYENEIESLFGLAVKHKSIDFEGKLYKMSKQAPFAEKDGE